MSAKETLLDENIDTGGFAQKPSFGLDHFKSVLLYVCYVFCVEGLRIGLKPKCYEALPFLSFLFWI